MFNRSYDWLFLCVWSYMHPFSVDRKRRPYNPVILKNVQVAFIDNLAMEL